MKKWCMAAAVMCATGAWAQSSVTLSGKVGGDVQAGDSVTLTVGTHTYTATVTGTAGNYTYSVGVPGSDLAGNSNVHASVTTTDAAGNPATATADHGYSVDITAPNASVTTVALSLTGATSQSTRPDR